MANIFRRIAGKIGGLFGRKPKRPKLRGDGGHRGIAMGSRKRPDLEAYRERVRREHETIPENEVEEFLAGAIPLFVHSSNVVMAQYYPDDESMQVEFKNGGAYLYHEVTAKEALSFAQAQSKGSWIWSNLRVRGTAKQHRKPWEKIK